MERNEVIATLSRDEVIATLSRVKPGFAYTNGISGREVEVLDKDRDMYYLKDRKHGLFAWTSSEEYAYRWLAGEILPDGWQPEQKPIILDDAMREKIRRWRKQLAEK